MSTAPEVDADEPGLTGAAVRRAMSWVAGTFGALALLFLPGLGLADIGSLTGWRLPAATLLFVIGFGTALAAALKVTQFVQLGAVTLEQLACGTRRRKGKLVRYVEDNPSLFEGEATTVEELYSAHQQALEELGKARRSGDDNGIAVAEARLEFVEAAVASVERSASERELRLGFAERRTLLALCAAVVALTMLGFACVAHPPDTAVGDLSGARLVDLDLSGADLRDANFSGTRFEHVNLSDANLEGADLGNTTWDDTTCPDGSVTAVVVASSPAGTSKAGVASCAGHLATLGRLRSTVRSALEPDGGTG